MKANRKFIEEGEAVSAVIGVILMVAITVAIAATVYYYVTVIMPTGPQSTPAFELRVDEENDRLIVSTADPSADWNRLAIKANKAGTEFLLNGEIAAAGDGTAVTTSLTEITGSADPMSATEYIDFEGTAADVTDVKYTLVDTTANAEIGTKTFLTIAQAA